MFVRAYVYTHTHTQTHTHTGTIYTPSPLPPSTHTYSFALGLEVVFHLVPIIFISSSIWFAPLRRERGGGVGGGAGVVDAFECAQE